MKILAIDDSPTLRQFITRSLQKYSSQSTVSTARDGEEGLALAESEAPELILLDFVLPGLRGDEVCRRLEKGSTTAKIPVILMSSSTKEMQATELECRNVVRSISKPFTPELLCATVNTVAREIAATAAESIAGPCEPNAEPPRQDPLPAADTLGSSQGTKTGTNIVFSGHTGNVSLISILTAIERGSLTGMLALWIDGREVQIYSQRGGILCATTRQVDWYLAKDRSGLPAGLEEEQARTACPVFLQMVRRGTISLPDAVEKAHRAGIALIGPVWTRPDTRFTFETLDELPEWLTGMKSYSGPGAEWALETLREVGEECLSAHAWGEPTGIPAYTRAGYERIQHIALDDEEFAFASRVDSRRTLGQIAESMQVSIEAATSILHRFLCLEIFDYWPATILRQGTSNSSN